MGVVKDVASTNGTTHRFDIGKSSDLNTQDSTGGSDSLTPYLTIDNGDVGIGTTSPAYKLDVHGPSNVGFLTTTSVSGNGSGLTSLNADNITSGTLGRPISTTTGTFSGVVTCNDVLKLEAGSTTGDTSVESTHKTITYIRFGTAGAGNDWAYLRQIGGTNLIKLALDFHDDNEARFEIRKVNSSAGSGSGEVATTVFSVDDGAVTATSFSGSGSSLTSLNADNLTSGTVSSDRLSLAASDIPDLSASKITSGTLGRPISTSTGVFTSTGNVVLVGPNGGGQVGLTINDGDGNANITFNHASRVPDQNGSSGRIDCGVDGTTGYMRLRVKSSVTGGTSTGNLPECVRIEEGYVRAYSNFYVDDNVGIGTTNPGARLEVLGNSANQWGNILYLKNSAGSNRLSLKDEQTSPYIPPGLWTGAGGGLSIGSQYEGIMVYASASGATPVERMRITSSGNIGIGTASPIYKLDVRGDVYVDNSSVFMSGYSEGSK